MIVGITIALLFSLWMFIVQKQSVQVDFACTNRLFNLSAEAKRLSRPAMRVCVSDAQYSFLKSKNSFLLSLGRAVYIFEENPKPIQDVTGDVYSPGKYCFNSEKCEFVDGYVTTPRSIRGCGKRGAWLFVYEVLFRLQEYVIRQKQKNTFFLC